MQVNSLRDSQLHPGQRIFVPRPMIVSVTPPRPVELVSLDSVRRLVGPKHARSDWRIITVHHSATLEGGAKQFHRDHIRRHIGGGGGLFYHFVIGNGTFTKDGEIEVGIRWHRQVKALRPYDIQICLVGDFNRQQVSEAQLSSLATLITVLREQYHIPLDHIRGHRDIRGKHTDCPGKNFPFQRLLAKLSG
jgi:hypothetical protein